MTTDDTAFDVGAWFTTLARNWWVVVGLVVLGVAVGAVITVAQPKEYTATSAVYIGQTTDANGSPMAGLNANSKAATQLLGSQTLLNEVAERTGMGMTAARLRRQTTAETPSSTLKTTTSVVNIIVISVVDTDKVRAAKAADAMAAVLLERIGGGVDAKIALLEEQAKAQKEQLAGARQRGHQVDAALEAIAHDGGTKADRAVASAPYIAIAQAAATESEALVASLLKSELMLLTAQQTERPRVLFEAATPDTPSGPHFSLNVAAGALAGLVVGIVAAFVRRRLGQRSG
ncbi:MAG: Wzz/FepE/Etk N-terminal domain-containing protein [Thermoleophilia bacterium]